SAGRASARAGQELSGRGRDGSPLGKRELTSRETDMTPQTVERPSAVELLQIALGGAARAAGAAPAAGASAPPGLAAAAGGRGGAVFGLIAALKHSEGEDGRGREVKATVAQAPAGFGRPLVKLPAPDAVRQAGRSAA